MEEQDSAHPQWGAWLKTIAGFVAPTTLLTGLLLFFGFAYTDSFYEYFAIDPATLGFSTQDYLLRSARPLYMPLGATLAVGLVGALGYSWISTVDTSRTGALRNLGRGSLVLIVCGTMLFVLGMLGGFQVWPAGPLDTPLLLGGGLVLVVYGRVLHLKSTGHPFPGEMKALFIIAALISLCCFWAVQAYAQSSGQHDARNLARHLWLRPAVVVDTPERLYFGSAPVRETALPPAGSAQKYKYRYRDLRLLAQSENRMFLIPDGWTPTRGAVMLVPADGTVRIAFRPG